MNVNISPVKYSSIVEIGDLVLNLENKSGDLYLKLHRGVMDIDTIELNSIVKSIDFNQKKIQQYGGNDGDSQLLNTIKSKFHLDSHKVVITPGGMAAIDLVVNSLSDEIFWVPEYHWGSWNKILKLHNKTIKTFNDFDISTFTPDKGVVMLCYPSNPTGYYPNTNEIEEFLKYCKLHNITVILDIPYYHLFNDFGDVLYNLYFENVIVLSSFSKSIGLSGFRVGYVATKNDILYDTLHIRSLYKYNSISNVSQSIINSLLINGNDDIEEYKNKTRQDIQLNIKYLVDNNLLFSEYPSIPTGPFAIINKTFDELMENKISSVPLSKFTLYDKESQEYKKISNFSRISVAVKHELFKKYFNDFLIK